MSLNGRGGQGTLNWASKNAGKDNPLTSYTINSKSDLRNAIATAGNAPSIFLFGAVTLDFSGEALVDFGSNKLLFGAGLDNTILQHSNNSGTNVNFLIREDTLVQGIQFDHKNTTGSNNTALVYSPGTNVEFNNCKFTRMQGNHKAVRIDSANSDCTFSNCIFLQGASTSVFILKVSTGIVLINNCSFLTGINGINSSGGLVSVTNCLFRDIDGAVMSMTNTDGTIANNSFVDCASSSFSIPFDTCDYSISNNLYSGTTDSYLRPRNVIINLDDPGDDDLITVSTSSVNWTQFTCASASGTTQVPTDSDSWVSAGITTNPTLDFTSISPPAVVTVRLQITNTTQAGNKRCEIGMFVGTPDGSDVGQGYYRAVQTTSAADGCHTTFSFMHYGGTASFSLWFSNAVADANVFNSNYVQYVIMFD